MSNPIKLIITDLDRTLLRSDKSISEQTKSVFDMCRELGILTAFATARAENAARRFIDCIRPDIVISCGGALVKHHDRVIVRKRLSSEISKGIIDTCLDLTGGQGEITVETDAGHFWNYRVKPGGDYSECIYTDFSDFNFPTYKITAELETEEFAKAVARKYPECETLSFRGEKWRRFAAKGADKVSAIFELCEHLQIGTENIMAFGDDYNDIEMLKAVGTGVAVENAPDEIKSVADFVTESNDNDGVALFLKNHLNL